MARFKTLSDRMKAYESTFKAKLNPRLPTIIRLDGKAFHTYCKKLERPFTRSLFENMELTMKYLVKNIQGCKLGYYQSDEITLVLTDFDSFDTQAWFDGEVQKICSISASMATSYLTVLENIDIVTIMKSSDEVIKEFKTPTFDARVFQVPSITEVINCIVWRQQDGVRNSIQASARSVYSHKECEKKNQSEMQEMIFAKGEDFKEQMVKCGWSGKIDLTKENFNWNDIPDKTKRGISCYKDETSKQLELEALDYSVNEIKYFVRTFFPLVDDFYED